MSSYIVTDVVEDSSKTKMILKAKQQEPMGRVLTGIAAVHALADRPKHRWVVSKSSRSSHHKRDRFDCKYEPKR
jgi:hypothetical protein